MSLIDTALSKDNNRRAKINPPISFLPIVNFIKENPFIYNKSRSSF